MLILKHIEVAHPVDEKHMTEKPTKLQGNKQLSKKFTQGTRIPRKPKHALTENMNVEKTVIYAKSMGEHTHHRIPWSVIATRRTEPPRQGTFVRLEERKAKT